MKMKKLIIITLTLFVLAPVMSFAQEDFDERPPRPENDLVPRMGDAGIGLDAEPFLNYIGNMFNGFNEHNTLALGDNTLYFRYFLMDEIAIRLRFNLNLQSDTETRYVVDDAALVYDPTSQLEVQDKRTDVFRNLNVWVGGQYFIGEGRLRGFGGVDLGYGYLKDYELYEWGNAMTELNPRPTSGWNLLDDDQRPLEVLDDKAHFIRAGLFTGAEFCIRKGFYIGVEMGVNYGYRIPGQNYTVYETMVHSEYAEMTDLVGRGNRTSAAFSGVPYLYGNLYLFFNFPLL